MELTALKATDADFFGTYGDDTTPGLLNSLPDNIKSVSDDESSKFDAIYYEAEGQQHHVNGLKGHFRGSYVCILFSL
jgi:hypothetical protein